MSKKLRSLTKREDKAINDFVNAIFSGIGKPKLTLRRTGKPTLKLRRKAAHDFSAPPSV
jgi:hypothetical protein